MIFGELMELSIAIFLDKIFNYMSKNTQLSVNFSHHFYTQSTKLKPYDCFVIQSWYILSESIMSIKYIL